MLTLDMYPTCVPETYNGLVITRELPEIITIIWMLIISMLIIYMYLLFRYEL